MKANKHAEFLVGLSPQGIEHVISPPLTKQIADALEKVGDALPPDQLRPVLEMVNAHQRWAIYEAIGRKPLPHLEPLLVPLLAARKEEENDFEATFFLAALAAGALHPAAALARVLGRTVHIPGVAKQAPKIETTPAVIDVAREVLSRYAPNRGGLCQPFQLVYGLVGVLAKDGSQTSADAIESFTRRAALKDAGAFDVTLRMVEAVGRKAPVLALSERLQQIEGPRLAATEAQTLAEKLALPLRDDKDWSISIWIGPDAPNAWFGMFQKHTQIHLTLCPVGIPDWEVEVREPTGARVYYRCGKELLRDDFGLPELKELAAFPRWLADAGAKLNVAFSPGDAKINCGPKRSSADLLRRWFSGAP